MSEEVAMSEALQKICALCQRPFLANCAGENECELCRPRLQQAATPADWQAGAEQLAEMAAKSELIERALRDESFSSDWQTADQLRAAREHLHSARRYLESKAAMREIFERIDAA